MKKTLFYLFLAAAFTLSGCGSSAAADVSETVPSTLNPFVPEETPATRTSVPEEEYIPAIGTYVSTSENFSGDYRPRITFSDGATYVMDENLYDGMGMYSGTYTYDGTYYDCRASRISFSGYAGDNIDTFSFMRFDANTIILLDDLCGSRAKDVFVLESEDSQPAVQEQYTIKPSQEIGSISRTTTYISSSDYFSDPYLPSLELNPDGTFTLTENLFAGMGHYTGTYVIDDINVILTVDAIDFSGFAGDKVKEIRFESLSPDVIQLMTDLCGSLKGDYWYADVQQ